jgi:hypothetical protein
MPNLNGWGAKNEATLPDEVKKRIPTCRVGVVISL